MKRLFLKVKPSAVLLLLKDSQQSWYPSKLARESNSSYVHTVNLLSALRKLDIVTVERKGKQNQFKLTEKGAHLASALDDFAKRCETCEHETKAAEAKQKADAQQSTESSQEKPSLPQEPKTSAEKMAQEKK